MNKNKELKKRISQLNTAVYILTEELAIKHYIKGMTSFIDDDIEKLEMIINDFKERANEYIFNLMLHSSHRSFMRYLKEMDD
jgi:hypothetical protein